MRFLNLFLLGIYKLLGISLTILKWVNHATSNTVPFMFCAICVLFNILAENILIAYFTLVFLY